MKSTFDAVINRYHMINKASIKESVWEEINCDITFSMSSQLWYKFNIKDINKFKICSTKIDNSKPKINY